MRINTCDHQRENVLIFYQILSTNSLRKSVDTSLRICTWILGIQGLWGKQLLKAVFTSSRDRVFFTWSKRHVRSVCYLHKHFVITFLPVDRIAKLIFK